jgi:hypothetical protein
MKHNMVVIIIPIHQEEPTDLEKLSLTQTLSVLYKYPIVFMAPDGLNTTWYTNFCTEKAGITVGIERFNWKGHDAYGTLLTKPVFYRRFLNYTFMLTCHMDAFVFRDELENWCALDYDYIGSVIYNANFRYHDGFLKRITSFDNPEYFGNGGFSLKKTTAFYRITSRFKFYIDIYHWQRKLRKRGFYDDLFHSVHYPKLSSKFKMAPKQLAQQFGADFVVWKEEDLPFTNQDLNTLPFGIHGWIKNQHNYWRPCIQRYGYEV